MNDKNALIFMEKMGQSTFLYCYTILLFSQFLA
jgi:hypothetical protein